MLAFIALYEDDQSIVQSLLDGCSHSETDGKVLDVVAEADLFLDALFYLEGELALTIYDSSIDVAIKLEATGFYCRLLVSKAFGSTYWGGKGGAMHLLSKAKEIRLSTLALSSEEREIACAILAYVSWFPGTLTPEFTAYNRLYCD